MIEQIDNNTIWEARTPSFCFYCGYKHLAFVEGPTNNYPPAPTCLRCDTHWMRLYTHACPACEDGDDWLHLAEPHYITVDKNEVTMATGAAYSELCGGVWVYKWQMLNVPTITIAGFTDGEKWLPSWHSRPALEVILSAS